MVSQDWLKFKEQYRRLHKEEDPNILDYIAVYGILDMCVHGASNTFISETLCEDRNYVVGVIREFLGFYGFKEDLDFSPYDLWRKGVDFPDNTAYEKFNMLKGKVDLFYARN